MRQPGEPQALLRVDVEHKRDDASVALVGELDISTVDQVSTALTSVRSRVPRRLVLDLRELSFMDSTGLHLIKRLYADTRADGCELRIVKGEGQVQRLFERTGLAEHLPVIDSPEQTGHAAR